MHPITYNGELVAIATRRRVFLSPHIATLEPGDPRRRMTVAMCFYARDVIRGDLPGPYNQDEAERYARAFLIADEQLPPGTHDEPIATQLAVPIEIVRARRRDLGQAPCWPTPAVPWADDHSYRCWLRGSADADDLT